MYMYAGKNLTDAAIRLVIWYLNSNSPSLRMTKLDSLRVPTMRGPRLMSHTGLMENLDKEENFIKCREMTLNSLHQQISTYHTCLL